MMNAIRIIERLDINAAGNVTDYGRRGGGRLLCRACVVFIAKRNRCVIHSEHDEIRAHGKCDFFTEGEPDGGRHKLHNHVKGGIVEAVGMRPLGLVTKKQSGYIPNVEAEEY